ncbi:hypothetical protein F4805DRAFT_136454 [Annulohypoxylon moriforme]|nr:hypothetical protein F4805DRAFT_136454 [Annulohypoxylon moriforme]
MDLAQNLVRTVARAFYTGPDERRLILIVDALVLHTTVKDSDLSYLMALNPKDLNKSYSRLREDHFLRSHSRPELVAGKEKPVTRTYYYIDYRQAIDAIKYRTFLLDKKVQGDAVPQAEKKVYFCKRCGSEWTQMEVLDNMDPMRGFMCHKCGSILEFDPERQAGGHELSTRLNNQLKFILDVLPKLDQVTIPEFDFDTARAASLPVVRPKGNEAAESVALPDAKPTSVKGMANTGPQKIEVDITDMDGPTEAEKEAARTQKEKLALQNALPSWHTTSTVSGISYSGSSNSATAVKTDEVNTKKPDATTDDVAHEQEMNELYKSLQRSQEEAARRAAEEEDDEDDEDAESGGEEFVDISANVSSIGEKRAASSGPTSAADTPASDRPPKKARIEEPANGGDSEDDDDMQFEDV